MAITKTQKYIFRDEEMPDLEQEPGNPPRQSILGNGELIRTSCGTLRRSQLLPQKLDLSSKMDALTLSRLSAATATGDTATNRNSLILPTDVGSRIGMVYTSNGKKGDLYIIVNGEEYGPMTKDIPINDGPLWPVVDVYGTTKQVEIVHLTISESLQTLCRDIITQSLSSQDHIDLLPLPTKMKNFLKFES